MPHIVISALVGGLLLVLLTGVGGWCCFRSRSRRGCCHLYRRAIFYLFAEKAEPLIFHITALYAWTDKAFTRQRMPERRWRVLSGLQTAPNRRSDKGSRRIRQTMLDHNFANTRRAHRWCY